MRQLRGRAVLLGVLVPHLEQQLRPVRTFLQRCFTRVELPPQPRLRRRDDRLPLIQRRRPLLANYRRRRVRQIPRTDRRLSESRLAKIQRRTEPLLRDLEQLPQLHDAPRRGRFANHLRTHRMQNLLPGRRSLQRFLTLPELRGGNPAGRLQLLGDGRFPDIQLVQLRVERLDVAAQFLSLGRDQPVQVSPPARPPGPTRAALFNRPGGWSQMDPWWVQAEPFRRLLVARRLRARDARLVALARHALRKAGALQRVVDVVRAQMTDLGHPVATVHRAVLPRPAQCGFLLVRSPEPLPRRPLEPVVDPLAEHQVAMPVVRRQIRFIRRRR